MAGKFITFEGIEGCGKTTQIKLIDAYLRQKGFKTVLTREPGGTKIGDNIRHLLLDPNNKEMHPRTELLLYSASRAQHVEELIKPAMNDGKIVLCDRYTDSTVAYQGAARRLDMQTIDGINKIATDSLKPYLTLIFDLPTKEGLARAKKRSALDRFEQEAPDFHERVRQGYLAIASREPARVKIINGAGSIDDIHKEVIKILDASTRP